MHALGFLIAAGAAVRSQSPVLPLAFVAPGRVFALTVVTFLVLLLLAIVITAAVRSLASERSRKLGSRRFWFFGTCALAALVLYLMRGPAAGVLAVLASVFSLFVSVIKWDQFFTALYDTFIATLVLILMIQVVGEVYWFNKQQLDRWHQRKAGEEVPGAIFPHLYRALSILNRLFRAAVIVLLLLVFFPVLFHLFPLTRGVILSTEATLQRPAAAVGRSIFNYLPHLGYLVVIAVLGWATLKLLRYVFDSLDAGTLVVGGFRSDWAKPTYNLLRALVLLFFLMVSYPHLPGASSEFFAGFSVFIGALVTFGSAGAVNNLVSGIVLTYTSAFHAGDMIRIGETTGIVVEKTLLVTRIRTPRNEEVSLPNSTVLSTSIVNFTTRAGSEGLALSVNAGIGYDVDWHTVHTLMIDGAKKTGHILTEPAPFVLQSELGNYAVNYQLLAWTDKPDRMLLTNSELRRNVLDAFNAAGVEIMTPSVLAHRDASEAAIPTERLQQEVVSKRIAIDVHNSPREGTHSKAA